MANVSRLGAQSTKALAKLAKKLLADLNKSSDKTKVAKKNVKNAEKLNTLVEGILDPVAEKDITGAEAKAIEVCGHINMTATEGDLLTGSVVTKSNIGLVLEPHPGSTSIYVAGVYRFNPADTSTGSDATDGLDFYFGFKS